MGFGPTASDSSRAMVRGAHGARRGGRWPFRAALLCRLPAPASSRDVRFLRGIVSSRFHTARSVSARTFKAASGPREVPLKPERASAHLWKRPNLSARVNLSRAVRERPRWRAPSLIERIRRVPGRTEAVPRTVCASCGGDDPRTISAYRHADTLSFMLGSMASQTRGPSRRWKASVCDGPRPITATESSWTGIGRSSGSYGMEGDGYALGESCRDRRRGAVPSSTRYGYPDRPAWGEGLGSPPCNVRQAVDSCHPQRAPAGCRLGATSGANLSRPTPACHWLRTVRMWAWSFVRCAMCLAFDVRLSGRPAAT